MENASVYAEQYPCQARFRDEVEQLPGVFEEDRKRLVDEHLAIPADETTETSNDKPNEERAEIGARGPGESKPKEPDTHP